MNAGRRICLNILCTVSAGIAAGGSFAPIAQAEPTTLTGTVTHVRDGDTIEVGRIPIHLNGVSAPEMNEPLGPQSKAFMTDLVMGKRLSCELIGDNLYDMLAIVYYFYEHNIGATVIVNGLALDCPRYSGGRYAQYEIEGALEGC